MRLSPKSDVIPAISLMAAVAFYRPLLVWAQNPWDLAAPQELFVVGLALLVFQICVFFALRWLGLSPLGAVASVAGSMFVLLQWHALTYLHPLVWLVLILAGAVAVRNRASWLKGIALISVAVLTLAPALQTLVSHLQANTPYPITDLAARTSVEATGKVEDVLILVVDSYPSLSLAASWFDHDTGYLISELTSAGFRVEENAWSHNTFTGLAVPGLLELKPIVNAGPTGAWGNRRSTYDLIRGDSLVATSLKSAGFEYTHVESGWDGAHCGANVDTCLQAPWVNEVTWKLLEPSVLRWFLLYRYGNISVPGSKQVTSHIESLQDQFDDGDHDYVFAHMILPHAPLLVDANCRLHPDILGDSGVLDPENMEPESADELSPQLSCVDSLLARVAAVVGDRTAVIITGDHGPASNGQVGRPPGDWSDADIAERLGILLAYRLPASCNAPSADSSLKAMRIIMSCATDIQLPENHGKHLIGAENPVWVDESRMDSIKRKVALGWVASDDT